jgi:hypothetical protein
MVKVKISATLQGQSFTVMLKVARKLKNLTISMKSSMDRIKEQLKNIKNKSK